MAVSLNDSLRLNASFAATGELQLCILGKGIDRRNTDLEGDRKSTKIPPQVLPKKQPKEQPIVPVYREKPNETPDREPFDPIRVKSMVREFDRPSEPLRRVDDSFTKQRVIVTTSPKQSSDVGPVDESVVRSESTTEQEKEVFFEELFKKMSEDSPVKPASSEPLEVIQQDVLPPPPPVSEDEVFTALEDSLPPPPPVSDDLETSHDNLPLPTPPREVMEDRREGRECSPRTQIVQAITVEQKKTESPLKDDSFSSEKYSPARDQRRPPTGATLGERPSNRSNDAADMTSSRPMHSLTPEQEKKRSAYKMSRSMEDLSGRDRGFGREEYLSRVMNESRKRFADEHKRHSFHSDYMSRNKEAVLVKPAWSSCRSSLHDEQRSPPEEQRESLNEEKRRSFQEENRRSFQEENRTSFEEENGTSFQEENRRSFQEENRTSFQKEKRDSIEDRSSLIQEKSPPPVEISTSIGSELQREREFLPISPERPTSDTSSDHTPGRGHRGGIPPPLVITSTPTSDERLGSSGLETSRGFSSPFSEGSNLSTPNSSRPNSMVSPKLEQLDREKCELVDSMKRKIEDLKSQMNEISEEIQENEGLGTKVTLLVEGKTTSSEFAKYQRFTGELNKIVLLLLSLTQRMHRYEKTLSELDMSEEADRQQRDILQEKIEYVKNQYEEACKIKEVNDKRGEVVSKFLESYLDEEEFADFQYYIDMKTQLALMHAEIRDKVKMGEERLNTLTTTEIDWSATSLSSY